MAPHLVVAGACDDPHPDETSVVAENQVVFKNINFLDGIESMMMLLCMQFGISKRVFEHLVSTEPSRQSAKNTDQGIGPYFRHWKTVNYII